MRPHDTRGSALGTDSTTDRRRFLLLGGSGVLAAAVLAACGSDEETPPGETGVTSVPEAETTEAGPQTTSPEDGATQDAVVTRTMRSFEMAANLVYAFLQGEGSGTDYALPAPIAYDPEVDAALSLLRDRHEVHATALEPVISDAGGEPVSEPNQGVLDGLLKPRLPSMTTQRSVLQFAYILEEMGAGTYGWGTGTLSNADLRQQLMATGSAAAGQATAVALQLEPTGEGVVPSGTLDTSGPVRLPEYMLVQPVQDGSDVPSEAPVEGEETEGEEAEEGEN